MKVSKKAYYGLRAAVSLADADGPVSARELAERERIPEEFLEKILQKLRRSGIVESKKGVEGGYALAEQSVSVWDILRALDGPVRTFTPPLGKGTLPCNFPSHCRTNDVLRRLEEEIEKTLSGVTISRRSERNQESGMKNEEKAVLSSPDS
ncbi:MAG: Rrf2 family transcriptional regulator [Candidatus Moranbacteria bacterium]|nr:Rrf2 family transcriptional regulator [Candidatus Moranbacteria bacterium]